MKSNLKSAIFAFLAAVAAAATILIPPASPITVFAGSLCLGLSIGYSKSPIFPAAAAVISCAAAYVVYDKLWIAALILLAIAPSGIAIGLAMKKAKSLNSAAMTTIILTLVLAAATLCVYTAENSDGFNPAQAMDNAAEQIEQAASDVYDSLYSYGQSVEDGSGGTYTNPFSMINKNDFVSAVCMQTVYMACTFAAVYFLCVTTAGYFIVRAVIRRRGLDGSNLTSFDRVQISKTTGIVYGILILVSLVASFALPSDSAAYIIIDVTYSVMGTVFFFAGLSVADYFFKYKEMSKPGRIAAVIGLAVAGAIISPLLADIPNLLITLAGWWDSLGSIRKRLDGGNKI